MSKHIYACGCIDNYKQIKFYDYFQYNLDSTSYCEKCNVLEQKKKQLFDRYNKDLVDLNKQRQELEKTKRQKLEEFEIIKKQFDKDLSNVDDRINSIKNNKNSNLKTINDNITTIRDDAYFKNKTSDQLEVDRQNLRDLREIDKQNSKCLYAIQQKYVDPRDARMISLHCQCPKHKGND